MPCCVVGVRFRKAGKVYYFDPQGLSLSCGDTVIVETARGVEHGQVVTAPAEVAEENVVAPLKKVIRPATPQDLEQIALNEAREKRAFQVGMDKIAAHGLPMKLVGVEQTFDGNKIVFYFTAEGRIDFRELVKDLAAVFRTRIELRQIGVRDEAKMMGGLGCCGRELCCSSWLSDFASVSIRMAKEQNLSLNPAKISGICGRLMCCLKYENEIYEQSREKYPETGSPVTTPDGEARVTGVNIFKRTVTVELKESRAIKEYPFNEVSTGGTRSEHCAKPECINKGNGNQNPRTNHVRAENKKRSTCPDRGKR
ncbi:PSP1 domain-containing protein [Desulfotomaculum copahuensis]|uniref:Stage 0 sporulation protein n=1 Tax=Desulfotomaculum copahuensis TaxID=1838280 RepID=A0A1B7LI83_9FIRM|nr:stage 0 sporulation family protein [Desulfotomaculum copahuensis]OAT86123.1 stage 0 sporulation protein [Desulfotomaculum copahuensis]